ncbi:daunorubicin resistance protein DrrA family ABC transporter ATP-binding protein [Actinospica robiniae]|uniref:daunorubicin resistance protein DrrA family ABC transporter ATP-binding protein n=1 Tax=Actinospica robiniae TaxID=304901 RepID=UPI000406A7F8|nr:daunorubicin resistance protein DrrA family ABC transporter ATP-binding protein [Actinospica robiniae]
MITTKGLRKSFQSRKRRQTTTVDAVRGVDLSVDEGEIFGFLGPNGAGKTTTLRMLATLLHPDGGEAMIFGADLMTDPALVRRRIGYVAQQGGTADGATAREELVIQARVHGIGKAEALERAAQAVEAFGMGEYADRPCKTYSGGQRRRLDIALGVIHRPRALFLDEPTVGLDPASRGQVWAEIRRLRALGMTVFVTTHYLDEADSLCDRVAIIDHGEIVAEGTPDDLKSEISGDVVIVGLGGGADAAAGIADRAAQAQKALADQPYVRKLEMSAEDALRVYAVDGGTAIPLILRALEGAGIEPDLVQLQRPSLDDVFLTKTGRTIA